MKSLLNPVLLSCLLSLFAFGELAMGQLLFRRQPVQRQSEALAPMGDNQRIPRAPVSNQRIPTQPPVPTSPGNIGNNQRIPVPPTQPSVPPPQPKQPTSPPPVVHQTPPSSPQVTSSWVDEVVKFDFMPTRFSTKSISYVMEYGVPVGWFQLYGTNGFKSYNVPEDFRRKAEEIFRSGQVINSVTFTPEGGWVIVGQRTSAWNLCSRYQSLMDKYNEITNARHHIKSVAVSPTGAGCIIFRNNGYSATSDAPADLVEFLQELIRQRREVHHVSFGRHPEGWIVLYGNNGFRCRNFYPEEIAAFIGRQ